MQVSNLSNTPLDTLIDCFLIAFENYFVPMPTDRNYYRNRWTLAGVDFNLSYGMFDGEKLVGFIINAVGVRNGKKIAFNTGTGVLPAYRGQRIVRSIYDHATPDLKKNGVTICSLEVIRENEIAVKAYARIGFTIVSRYKCYQGGVKNKLDFKSPDPAGTGVATFLQKSSKEEFEWEKASNQLNYSWDFQRETIIRGNYAYYYVIHQGVREAYFIIDPESGNLAQFDLLKPSNNGWNRIFDGISQVTDTVRIINVNERLTEKIAFLEQLGLTNTVDQYEMELTVTSVFESDH